MKYEKALLKMNLKAEDFPNSTRKKIADIAKIQNELADLKKSGQNEEATEAQEVIDDLDSQLEETILNFDIESHKARLQKLADMREKRWGKDGKKPAEKNVEQPKPTNVVETVPPVPQPASVPPPPPTPTPAKVVDIAKNEKHEKKELVNEEFEEFEKTADIKKKKVNWSAIGIGVGALILTFGAVNYFKNNK